MTPAERRALAASDLVSDHPMVIEAGKLYEASPHLYEAFEDATLDLIDAGWTLFSHWLVANYVRYTAMRTTGGEFKVPNGVIAVWARQFIYDYPEHDVFRIKSLKHDCEGDA